MAKFLGPQEIDINYSSRQLVKDIFKLLQPYRWRSFVASLIRFLGDVAWLYPAYALAYTVTTLSRYPSTHSLGHLWIILELWVLASVVRNFSQFFAKYLGYQISERVSIDAMLKTVRHLFLLDMAWHEKENSGNKLKRIQNAGDGLDRIIRIWFNSLIEVVVNFGGMIFIVSRFDIRIAGMMALFLVTYFTFSSILLRKAGLASYNVNAQEEEINGLLFEAINNIKSVKVMSMTRPLYKIVSDQMKQLFTKVRLRIFRFQFRSSFLSMWAHGFRLACVTIIIFAIIHHKYEVGFLILFITYFGYIWESVNELSDATQDFITAKYSIARMNDILLEPINIDDDKGKLKFPNQWQRIIVKNLSFSYEDNRILNNISFEISRGEKIGIVGLSGAGKSTLFKLLLKEREEFDGDILFDGLSIKQIKKSDYFKYVSVVLQDTEVFNFSLKDNITIANFEQAANQPLLQKALTIGHVYDFTDKLPLGLNTVIGEKGLKLSGGEKQRVGLARAIFKEPQILLLDEATSHLDLESEEKIRDSLHQFFENVTAVVIAHRLTTIRAMDKILVIEDGKIIESGNFEELYKKQGRFFELWEKQKL